jgi:hypothetical protein
MPHLSLSEEDIDKIATAVKQKITVDIESIITAVSGSFVHIARVSLD